MEYWALKEELGVQNGVLFKGKMHCLQRISHQAAEGDNGVTQAANKPWQIVSLDLFQHSDKDFLLQADRYSEF